MITKKEYEKAKKVVDKYESQKQEIVSKKSNKFGFLFWLSDEDYFRSNGIIKEIIAKNIDDACTIFFRTASKKIKLVDYEVSNGDAFIDIGDRKDFIELHNRNR